jgi:hypothetical protein
MCWAGKHLEMPTGMKKGESATAIATSITARATSLAFMINSFRQPIIIALTTARKKPLPLEETAQPSRIHEI